MGVLAIDCGLGVTTPTMATVRDGAEEGPVDWGEEEEGAKDLEAQRTHRKAAAQAREGTVADAALRLDCLCCGVAGNSTASDSSLCCAERCCGSSRLSRGMVDLGCFRHCSDCVCILCWCT